MKWPTTRDGMPVLDEESFQRLLAAAYVLQQHQERARAAEEATRASKEPDSDYAKTLAEIVEIQHQIQVRHLDLDGAAGYVVEQVQRITGAAGAAVGLLDRDHLVYRAVSGLSAADLGSALPKNQAISVVVLNQGTVLRCPSVRQDSNLNREVIHRAGIGSFISVPIFHDDLVAGVLELVFKKANSFSEYDVHTCQMMAGLVTEALARAADEGSKRSLTAERDSMLKALEKLKPQLDRLAKDAEQLSSSAAPDLSRSIATPPMTKTALEPWPIHNEPVRSAPRASTMGGTECQKCGNHLGEQEVYCGSCGTLRSERPVNGQKASLSPSSFDENPLDLDQAPAIDTRPLSARMPKPEFDLPPEVLALVENERNPEPTPDIADELLKLLPPQDWEEQQSPEKALPAPTGYPWTSAANARAWLNSLSDPKTGNAVMEFMRVHRGDISLAAATLLVFVAIFWSRADHTPAQASPSVTTSASSSPAQGSADNDTPEPDPQAQLSIWDRALIGLGIAEAPSPPPAPQALGGPAIKVWIDLHTALYYCPGAELYGKTEKGRFALQGEAQSDHIEPASGKVCE
jgi:putative methionine-R-sulfoxide reductase with GAF domain